VTEVSDWSAQAKQLLAAVSSTVGDDKLDAVLCVAGGFAMGKTTSDDYIESCDLMWKQSVWSSTIASRIAALHMKEAGLLQLTGAQAATGARPVMIGYGLAKAAVMQLVGSLATKGSGLPANTSVVGIVPITLDTAGNRHSMPKSDFTAWTPLEFVASLLFDWCSKAETRPKTGSLVHLITKNGETELQIK